MTVFEIVEAVVIGVLVLLHVVSNFYNARCSCKLCKIARGFLPQSSTDELAVADPEPTEELFKLFIQWLDGQKENK